MGVCDAYHRFTYVDIGAYGKQSDGGVFAASKLGISLENGSLHVPKDSYIENTNRKLPYVLVADEAFPLKRYLMR